MAVGFSASSESHTGTTGSVSEASFQWTHTPVGTPKGVLIFLVNLDTDQTTNPTITYGGVDVPAVPGGVAVDTATELGRCATFFLGSGVPTGAQTVLVNRNNTANEIWCVCITVTAAAGIDTEVHLPGIVLLQENGTLTVQSVTDGSPGSNSMRFAGGMSGLAAPPPAGTGSTLLQSFDTGNQVAAVVRETTAGQGARNVGLNSTTADDRAVVHLAVREVPPDVTAPVLTSQTVGSLTTVGGTPAVTTDEGNGTLHMVVVPNLDSPSVAQIKAGQNSSGGAALDYQGALIFSAGVMTFLGITGLTSNTAYDCWFVHTDAVGNNSTAVKADFTTLMAFADARRGILEGLAASGAGGDITEWDAFIAAQPDSAVVRTSDTVVTITPVADAGFDIAAAITIEDTIPGEALVGAAPIVATPTFTVDSVSAPIGTVASTFSGVASAATGTYTPLAITGTVASALGGVASAETAVETFSGTATSALGPVASAETAVETFSGAATSTLGGVAGVADGTNLPNFTGTVASALGGVAGANDGVVLTNISGTVDSALGGVASSETGTYTPLAITGTVTSALGGAGVASTAALKFEGAIASALAGVATAETASLRFSGSVGSTLAPIASAETAVLRFSGAVTSALGAPASAAAGQLRFAGSVSSALGGARSAETAVLKFEGAVTSALAGPSSAATGTYVPPARTGTVASTLGGVAVAGTQGSTVASTLAGFAAAVVGVYTPLAITGTVVSTLGGVRSAETGIYTPQAITGTVVSTLGGIRSAETGVYVPLAISGTVTTVLGSLAGAVAATYTPTAIIGTVAATLAPVKSAEVAVLSFNGIVSSTLAAAALASAGVYAPLNITGAITSVIGGASSSSTGVNTPIIPAITGMVVSQLAGLAARATGPANQGITAQYDVASVLQMTYDMKPPIELGYIVEAAVSATYEMEAV